MKYRLLFLTLLSGVFILSCSTEENKIETSMLDQVWVHDLANDELASDLRVLFDLKSTNGVEGVQILVAKESPLNEISVDYLKSLGANSYTSVPLTDELSYDITLNREQVDTDGDLLEYDQLYFIYLFSPDLGIINVSEESFLFSNNKVVSGSYIGKWNDTLFGAVNISIIFTNGGGDTYRGPTYISSNFSPTYGGADDGKTTIEIENGDIILFKYLQYAPNYKGGCPGIYEGAGEINSNFDINIDFTGDDCDGYHDDAQFVLKRLWKY